MASQINQYRLEKQHASYQRRCSHLLWSYSKLFKELKTCIAILVPLKAVKMLLGSIIKSQKPLGLPKFWCYMYVWVPWKIYRSMHVKYVFQIRKVFLLIFWGKTQEFLAEMLISTHNKGNFLHLIQFQNRSRSLEELWSTMYLSVLSYFSPTFWIMKAMIHLLILTSIHMKIFDGYMNEMTKMMTRFGWQQNFFRWLVFVNVATSVQENDLSWPDRCLHHSLR